MSKSTEVPHFERKLFELVDLGNPRQLLAFFQQSQSISDTSLLEAVDQAARGGNSTLLQILMAAGADFRRGDRQHVQGILVSAINSGNLNNVRILTEEGITSHLPEKSIEGPTPIQVAIANENDAMLELLLSAGCALAAKDGDGYTALHTVTAAKYAERLIKAGAVIDYVSGPRQYTPLHLAVDQGKLDIIRVLLEHKARVDVPEQVYGYIPLHIAITTGRMDVVDLLLKYKACKQVNYVTPRLGKSALHLVTIATPSYTELIRKLMKAGAKSDIQDHERNTPLMSALKSNNITLATQIFSCSSADQVVKSVLASDKDGNNVLHVMCHMTKHPEVVPLIEKILRRLPDCSVPEKINGAGMTALTVAARNGHTAAAKFLLHWGVNVNAKSTYGSPMHVAVTVGNDEIALLLLKVDGLRFEACDKFGETVLHKAALVGNCKIIHCILDRGISPVLINQKGAKSRTVLHYLMKRSCLDVPCGLLRRLAQSGANLDVVDVEGDTPLIKAIRMQTENTGNIGELLKLDCKVNIVNCEGKTALHYACLHRRLDVVQILVERGADCNVQDSDKNTALHISALRNHEEILLYILASPAQIHLNLLSENKRTLLHYTAQVGMHRSFELILEKGAVPDVVGAAPSPLILAAQCGYVNMVQSLLARGAVVNAQDNHGITSLMWAASQGHIDCIHTLVSNGADSTLMDNSGDTALTKAAWGGHTDALRALIVLSPDLNHPEGEEGMTALALAIAREHIVCVNILLKAGADINIVDNHGNTALLTAAMLTSGSRILEMILKCDQKYDINAVGDKGRTCLHWGVGEPESLELLLRHEPDLNVLDNFKASPLLLAIAHKQPESARLLIEAGCRVNMVHDDGRKPIHHAAIYGDSQTTRLLIEKGVDPDSPMKDGRRPLVLASIENHSQVIRALLQYNVRVDRIYFDAFTALSTAVSNHHMETMKLLLEHGANPDTIGCQKHRPFVQAILHNIPEAVMALVQAGADVDLCSDDEQHPMYLASMKNSKMVQLMLQIGCRPESLHRLLSKGLIDCFIEDEELLRQICYLSKQPWSLCSLCRGVLRISMRCPLAKSVKTTMLPQSLKDYVLYRELNDNGN